MKKLVIWGGNKKELNLENLDSHASINAFFLSKYLSEFYQVFNFVDIDKPEEMLKLDDFDHILSTFQYGISNKIVKKGKHDLFQELTKRTESKIGSICDSNVIGKFYEDILFTVRPPSIFVGLATNLLSRKTIRVSRSGWNAEPDLCYPKSREKNYTQIFLDHPPYGNQRDLTQFYFKSIRKVKKIFPGHEIRVFQQNNRGIQKIELSHDFDIQTQYERKAKVPFTEILNYYRDTDIFCITHRESAGLSAIEAALCGAKLYVPKIGRQTYLRDNLLETDIPFQVFRPGKKRLIKMLTTDISKNIDRFENHQLVKNGGHTWENAARIIHRELES